MIKKDVTPQDIVHGVQRCVIPLGPLNFIEDHLSAKGVTKPAGDAMTKLVRMWDISVVASCTIASAKL